MNGQLVLFAAAVVALASFGVDGEPQKCCMLPQWSAKMTDLKSTNTVMDDQMDFGRRMQALLTYSAGSKTPTGKMVYDYNKGMMYTVQINNPQFCQKSPFAGMPLMRCIPDDAEYLGDSFMGKLIPASLPYHTWRIKLQQQKLHSVLTIAVSQKGCVPIVEDFSYPDYPNQGERYMFSGFRPGLTDPSAFDLPDSCSK